MVCSSPRRVCTGDQNVVQLMECLMFSLVVALLLRLRSADLVVLIPVCVPVFNLLYHGGRSPRCVLSRRPTIGVQMIPEVNHSRQFRCFHLQCSLTKERIELRSIPVHEVTVLYCELRKRRSGAPGIGAESGRILEIERAGHVH